MKQAVYRLWLDYRSEIFFGCLLSALLVVSAWLSHLIPSELFDRFINPAMSIGFTAICFFGAGLCLKHHDGIRVRRSWAFMLIAWGVWEIVVVVASATLNSDIMKLGTDTMSGITMVLACLFAWLLFIYPTEVLRPGWLNCPRSLLQIAPLVVFGVLDYFVSFDLRWLIALYPVGLMVLLVRHIRRYRLWCEDNFSTLDDIDVQWIVRYVIMVTLAGLVFYWLCISKQPARAFTQQWFLMFVLSYSTERVLYRPDPWTMVHSTTAEEQEEPNQANATHRAILEAWLEKEKPYLNPDFQLADIRQILPLNRTYLSQFINSEYGCSFFQWVNGMRIEEAKRMRMKHPEWTSHEIASRCGFSSLRAFYRTFSRETGQTPNEWWLLHKDNS